MEVKQAEITPEIYEEWSAIVRDQECAECGGPLTIHTIPERQALTVGCPTHPQAGFRQRTCYTEDYRRGAAIHPTIRDNIEKRMVSGMDFPRAVNLLALRFPDSIKDRAGAALFIRDCLRLGLDPLIQPAEAVPIRFKTKDENGNSKDTVAMVLTEDGALSMAARGCPDEYQGAPATMELLDYLMGQHKERPLAELEEVAKRTAKSLCDDKEAFVWVALGRRRTAVDINPVYGYYTRAEYEEAKRNKLPAGRQPGNQARVRAVKRWVRENFPESRQKMLEYTALLEQRSQGVAEASAIIDAEYRVLIEPSHGETPLISSPAGAQKEPDATKHARGKGNKKADNKAGESAQRPPGQQKGGERGGGPGGAGPTTTATTPSGADEHDLFSAAAPSNSENCGEPAIAGNGFTINRAELTDLLTKSHWSEGTARSWITSKWPEIQDDKSFEVVLKRLDRAKAEIFMRELQERAENQPNLL